MTKQKIMPWLDLLPGGDAADLQQRRESIRALTRQAADATFMATLLTRQAEQLRARASSEACSLEREVRGRFSADAVEKAKKNLVYPSR